MLGLTQFTLKVEQKSVIKVGAQRMGFRCAPMDTAKVTLSSYRGLSAHLHSGHFSNASCDFTTHYAES